MKASTIKVCELVSTLSVAGVHRQLSTLPGVHHADVNYVAGSATVHYGEAQVTVKSIRQRIVDCGDHCRGELVPAHLCDPAEHTAGGDAHAGHAGLGDHGGHGGAGGSSPNQKADMMHDMGHAPGMSMQGMADDMRNRFLVALVFAVPVCLYSPMGEMFGSFPTLFGMERKRFLFFATMGAIAYPVWPFLVAAVRAARNRVANRAALIVLSVGTGHLFSVGATYFYDSEAFFEASAVLLAFILLGHWLEMRARAGASDAIRALMDLAPPMATVVRAGVETQVPTAQVLAGETVVIKPGDKIPVDGEVTEGSAQVDESKLTGESMPVQKVVGNPVIGATIHNSGSFRYKATKVGVDTTLAQIVKLMQEAQKSKAPGQLLADQASQSDSSAVLAINALMLKRTKLAGIKRVGSPAAPATAAVLAAGASA